MQISLQLARIAKANVFCISFFLGCSCSVPESWSTHIAPPTDLKVGEGFVNPLGYYESIPRFSWKLSPESDSDFQSAYQVQVASSIEKLESRADLWDSQKVFSDDTAWIQYPGEPFYSRQKVYWRVRIWDGEERVSKWSDTQTIELGLLANTDWDGRWIGHPDTELNKQPSKQVLGIPQYFRKSFIVSGDVTHARLYITAKGLFKPFINGAPVAEYDVMTPGWTPYSTRIETLTYDVTEHLSRGENIIAASLAGGWYSGRVGDQHLQDFRRPPRLLAQLEVTYRDGRTQLVATNDDWKTTQQGPIRFASNYDGERYDQSFEMPGWSSAEFDDSAWYEAIEEPLDEQVLLRPKRHAPVRISHELPVLELTTQSDGAVIFDFGQNMVGVPRVRIPAIAGREIRIRYAEALDKGTFYTDNYRSALSTDYFLPEKTGIIEYQPTFTFHGYRYVEITGYDTSKTPRKDWVKALVQHSDVNLHFNFESSHAKLNQLSQNILWGLRSNFFDIPLDCPQRDERLGWTGDAQVFATPSMYMADVYGFWSAWLQSMREEQREDGSIPLYVPFVDWINWASSGWGDAATIIPWELYLLTGDQTILEDNYQMMTRWVAYHGSQSIDHISGMQTFGDWLQPYPNSESQQGNRGDTDFALISTAFYARSVEITKNAAEVLGKEVDLRRLSILHGQIKTAFQTFFFDEQVRPRQVEATQTTYLLGLAFGLFDPEEKALAEEHLVNLIKQADMHLRTGFLGTPLLASVLQNAGRSDLAYELLLKESYPSWFHSINNGATTTWERWDSYSMTDGFNPQLMNSLNHYAYGSVSRWFYEGILGITSSQPGFDVIRIQPQFSTRLTSARGGFPTPHGDVGVNWKVSDGILEMTFTIPKNAIADIVLPDIDGESLMLDGVAQNANRISGIGPGQHALKANFLNSFTNATIMDIDGLVVIEAEDFVSQERDDVRRWYRFNSNASQHDFADSDPHHVEGASGGAYLEVLPDTRAAHDDRLIEGENFINTPGHMAVLSYPVFFSEAGRYYIWARSYSTNSEDNGVHFGLDGRWPESSSRVQWCEGKHRWTWSSARRVPENHCGEPLTAWLDVEVAGHHTLQVSMREDGFELDKIILAKDKSFAPSPLPSP